MTSWCHVTVIDTFLLTYQHSWNARTNVWEMLASLVTDSLQSRDYNIMTGLWKVVSLPSFLFITCIVSEL